MRRHRTTARGALLILLLALAGVAHARPEKTPTRIVFPVLGPAVFSDDFGDARPQGRHDGIDIVARRKALALAAEAGRVRFSGTSSRAGCMVYLTGASGTSYRYIHLNNDLTKGNDNRGTCVGGVAYPRGLKQGARVTAGQPIGYVGDSGDANGAHPHLHFELHPNDGPAVNPYRWLRTADRLLFAAPLGTPFVLRLAGTVVSVEDDALRVKVNLLRAWPMAQSQSKLGRTLVVAVPETAAVEALSPKRDGPVATSLARAQKGQPVEIRTAEAPTTLRAQRGDDRALEADLVRLSPAP